MGRTIDYVRVSAQELEQILSGNANDLLDAIADDYHSIRDEPSSLRKSSFCQSIPRSIVATRTPRPVTLNSSNALSTPVSTRARFIILGQGRCYTRRVNEGLAQFRIHPALIVA